MREQEARETRDAGEHGREHDLNALRVHAEVRTALFVVAHRNEQLAGIPSG